MIVCNVHSSCRVLCNECLCAEVQVRAASVFVLACLSLSFFGLSRAAGRDVVTECERRSRYRLESTLELLVDLKLSLPPTRHAHDLAHSGTVIAKRPSSKNCHGYATTSLSLKHHSDVLESDGEHDSSETSRKHRPSEF